MSVFSSLVKKSRRASTMLVFDIGSTTLSVAYILLSPQKETSHFAFHISQDIVFDEKKTKENIATSLNMALQKIAKAAQAQMGKMDTLPSRVDEIHCFIHAPWTTSLSKTTSKPLQKKSKITKELLQEFVNRNFSVNSNDDIFVFDSHITNVCVNGYDTNNPYSSYGETLGVTLIESSMNTLVHTELLDALWQVFPQHEAHLHPFIYTLFETEHILDKEQTFTFLDVGGAYSSISTIMNGKLLDVQGIDFGAENILNPLLKENPENKKTALSALNMYMKGTCTPAECRRVETLLQEAETKWFQAFSGGCDEINHTLHIPSKVFITAPHYALAWIAREIEKTDFSHYTITQKRFRATPLYSNTFIATHSSNKNTNTDILSLETEFLHRKHFNK